MTMFPIRKLNVANYKSIDTLSLEGLTPFTVLRVPMGRERATF